MYWKPTGAKALFLKQNVVNWSIQWRSSKKNIWWWTWIRLWNANNDTKGSMCVSGGGVLQGITRQWDGFCRGLTESVMFLLWDTSHKVGLYLPGSPGCSCNSAEQAVERWLTRGWGCSPSLVHLNLKLSFTFLLCSISSQSPRRFFQWVKLKMEKASGMA